jgi:hypothetical protein
MCAFGSKFYIHFLAWWLTSVIPATWEVEIRRILVQGQLRQKVSEISSQWISWM